jgi:exosome complex exonuclease DIS3/RRP44
MRCKPGSRRQFLKNQPHLFDFIGVEASSLENDKVLNSLKDISYIYSEHVDASSMDVKVRTGELIRGKYRVNRNNPNEGIVTTTHGFEVKIIGKDNNNRAILGDVVAIELEPQEKWETKKIVEIKDEEEEPRNQNSAISEEKKYSSLKETILKENLNPTGKVVGIIKRDLRNLAGQLSRIIHQAENCAYVLVDPVDPRFPSTILVTSKVDNLKNKKIIFNVDGWRENLKHPVGHLVGIFGEADDMNTESKVILFEHNIETRSFSREVINCLPPEGV